MIDYVNENDDGQVRVWVKGLPSEAYPSLKDYWKIRLSSQVKEGNDGD